MYVIITAIIIVIMTQWIVMLGGGFYTRKNKFSFGSLLKKYVH